MKDRVSGLFVEGFVSSVQFLFSLVECMAYIKVKAGELEGKKLGRWGKKHERRVE